VIRDIAAWQFNPLNVVDFVAVHEAVHGPYRTRQSASAAAAFGGKADIQFDRAAAAFHPKRKWAPLSIRTPLDEFPTERGTGSDVLPIWTIRDQEGQSLR
jgi:hypothetical protein